MKKKLTKVNDEQTVVLRDQLARVLADYDNLKKRVEKDRDSFEKLANLRLVVKLLPVLDVLKQAQNHLKDQGVAVTIKEFEDALKQEGVEGVKVEVGDEFNPELEEVLEVVPGKDDNKIAEVILPGYKFIDGPVIRHAKVKVFSKGN
ncbi:MAG: nucleotide exchange factor GrpE [Microgenomates group bacterium]